jgi:hypothetical protein
MDQPEAGGSRRRPRRAEGVSRHAINVSKTVLESAGGVKLAYRQKRASEGPKASINGPEASGEGCGASIKDQNRPAKDEGCPQGTRIQMMTFANDQRDGSGYRESRKKRVRTQNTDRVERIRYVLLTFNQRIDVAVGTWFQEPGRTENQTENV